MKPTHTYAVRPRLPEPLAPLNALAQNLWWSWNHSAIELFRRIDRDLWEEGRHNPVLLLGRTDQARLESLTGDSGFLSALEQVNSAFQRYMIQPRSFERKLPRIEGLQIAYFSAEYGLSSCLPIYSGGLGVLSGDHLKTASDLGLPLTAVGLAYRQGYFHQYLNQDGWQHERYDENDFYNMPIKPVLDGSGARVSFMIPCAGVGGGGRSVAAGLWQVDVGRVKLYLLTTNLPQNSPEDREITAQLYGGDREMRIRQEIVLGVGGRLALRLLGITPTVYHMNEGHSAFLPLEQMRELIEVAGLSFDQAFEASAAGNVFTTHTPVAAGNDVFDNTLLKTYLSPLTDRLGKWDDIAALGRDHFPDATQYCMTVAALRCSSFSNAVSRLHSKVSRSMWFSLWPDVPRREVPIRPITNGIHVYSWLSSDMARLFDRYLEPGWRADFPSGANWGEIHHIPPEELWRTHQNRRMRLAWYVRQRLARQIKRRGGQREEVRRAEASLNPEALTIGFARRFATYKRATLLFRDIERLRALLGDRQRPVQIIFAGKAHPRDDDGKKFIREIVHQFSDPALGGRIFFLEDYDMTLARYLVQGCDVWLNTPRRPLEASGTSGMKAVANGGLHLSTLDGWWAEGYDPSLGWAIGSGEEYDDAETQDSVECDALFDLLEREVVPEFYDRSGAGLPAAWVARMKRSMAELIPAFSSHRMLNDYIEQAYLPAHERTMRLCSDDYSGARQLAAFRAKVTAQWDKVRIAAIDASAPGELQQALLGEAAGRTLPDVQVGEELEVSAIIAGEPFLQSELRVELYGGGVDAQDRFRTAAATPMQFSRDLGSGRTLWTCRINTGRSGLMGFTVRVLPSHPLLGDPLALGKICWAPGAV